MPKKFLNIDDFSKGINNVKNRRDLRVGEASALTNFDIGNRGELKPLGYFHEATNASAVAVGGTNVDVVTASVNPGYGLHYFEYDTETGTAGFSIAGTDVSGDITIGAGGVSLGASDGTDSNYLIGFISSEFTQTVNITSGDATVTHTANSRIVRGLPVSGTGIPSGATIASVTNTTTFELSANATASSSPICTFTDTQPVTQLNVENSNWIAISAATDFLTNSSNSFLKSITNSDFPVKVVITGTALNNGTYNILSVHGGGYTGSGVADFIGNYGANHSIKAKSTLSSFPLVMQIAEDLTHETIAAATTVNFKRSGGYTPDVALLLGNTDDSKVDVFHATTDTWATDVIDLESIVTSGSYPEWVFYSANSAVRIADANKLNISIPKWYGYIKRDQFTAKISNKSSGTVYAFVSRSIPSGLYVETNNLEAPSSGDFIAAGSVNGTNEYNMTAGKGWSISVTESTDEGTWEALTYEFATTFIYDGNQESLINELSTTFTATGLKKFLINVYAYYDKDTEAFYANRISGGRVYIRESGTSDDWTLLADIDIRRGVRTSLLGAYDRWVLDGATGAKNLSAQKFRVTIPTNTTTGNRASQYWMLSKTEPSLETYTALNGFDQSATQLSFGIEGSSYSTAIVANRRAFVANVKYNSGDTGGFAPSGPGADAGYGRFASEFVNYGDRIMFSEIGRYDTFPNFNYIEASKGDSESYIRLESFADRLLAFKQRTMQVINISSSSPNNWFVEDTVYSAGVLYPYSVAKGTRGIIWANTNGVYIYNGNSVAMVSEGKISDSDWLTFSNGKQLSVGYIGGSDQALIIQDVDSTQEAYLYDIRANAFTFADNIDPNSATLTEPPFTNFVNDSSGNLIMGYDVEGTSLGSTGTNDVHFTRWVNDVGTHKVYLLETPDFDLGSPALIKKFYKIYITYQHTDSNAIPATRVFYQINQNGNWLAMDVSNSTTNGFPQKNGVYGLSVFAPSSIVSFQSIAFKLDFSLSNATKFYVNDIQIEYRVINKRGG
tara:strand:+ start:35 stop:3073 length:3039 start_codon:yes stop_codon:yes gene_type:complete